MRRSPLVLMPLDDRQAARSAAIAAMGYRLATASRRARSRRPTQPKPARESSQPSSCSRLWSRSRLRRFLYSVGQEPAAAIETGSKGPTSLVAISRTGLLCLGTAMGSTLLLYWGKSRADMLDRDIGRIIHATEDARGRTRQLQAEWVSLNDPVRLQQMADHYLALGQIAPAQYVPLGGLQDRLAAQPAPLPPAPSSAAATAPHATVATEGQIEIGATAAARPAPVRAGSHPAPPVLVHFEPKARASHPADAGHYDLPHWLTDAHAAPRVMSEPPHMLTLPRGTALPLAAPPITATSMQAMAKPAPPPPEKPRIVAVSPLYPTAAPYAGQAYRPAYGTAYGQPYGGYYAYNAYNRPYLPPPVPFGSDR